MRLNSIVLPSEQHSDMWLIPPTLSKGRLVTLTCIEQVSLPVGSS